MHILSPETDNCSFWISGRERMTVENISWSISTKECCRPRRGWTRDLLVSNRTAHPTEPPRPALSVADWTTDIRARQLWWWCLSAGFALRMFLLGFADLFASFSLAPFLMRPRHFARSCAICSHDSVGMLKSLTEALRSSLYRFYWPPWDRKICPFLGLHRGFSLANVPHAS